MAKVLKTEMEKRLINISLAEKCGWIVDEDNWINKKRVEVGDEEYLANVCVRDLTTSWNPFRNQANAFRLAVRFGIGSRFNETLNQAFAWSVQPENAICVNVEDFNNPEEAMMYAICICVYERF